MKDLDFRGFNFKTKDIASFALKKDAVSFAKKYGWQNFVISAANNLGCIYVIGQIINYNTIRYLKRDGSWIDLKFPGYW